MSVYWEVWREKRVEGKSWGDISLVLFGLVWSGWFLRISYNRIDLVILLKPSTKTDRTSFRSGEISRQFRSLVWAYIIRLLVLGFCPKNLGLKKKTKNIDKF